MPATFLESTRLYTPCTLDHLPFDHTGELPDLDESFGQPRAVEALRFGLGIRRTGFNLFVLGEPGSGRHALVHRLVDEARRQRGTSAKSTGRASALCTRASGPIIRPRPC